jgi:hypothetical protein
MGFIHSKLRNSLSAKTVEKLVLIKSNMSAFYSCPTCDDYTNESVPIMPASINVTWNKTMVLIQIEFYSLKP